MTLKESKLRALLKEHKDELPEDFYGEAWELLGGEETVENRFYDALRVSEYEEGFLDAMDALVFDHGMAALEMARKYVFDSRNKRVMQGQMLHGVNCEFELNEKVAEFRDLIIKDALTHPAPEVRHNAIIALCNLDYHERTAGRIRPELADWLDEANEKENNLPRGYEFLKKDFVRRAQEIRDKQEVDSPGETWSFVGKDFIRGMIGTPARIGYANKKWKDVRAADVTKQIRDKGWYYSDLAGRAHGPYDSREACDLACKGDGNAPQEAK